MADITFAVNAVYFDEMQAGVKLEEYRLVTDYWKTRLVNRVYDHVVITKGYPKADDMDRRLVFKWNGYMIKTICHPHFGDEPVEVFAIDVSQRVCVGV